MTEGKIDITVGEKEKKNSEIDNTKIDLMRKHFGNMRLIGQKGLDVTANLAKINIQSILVMGLSRLNMGVDLTPEPVKINKKKMMTALKTRHDEVSSIKDLIIDGLEDITK